MADGVMGKDNVAAAAAASSPMTISGGIAVTGGNSSNITTSSPTGAASAAGDLKPATSGISMRQQRGSVGGQQQQFNTLTMNNLENIDIKATITPAATATATEMANKGATASNNIKKNSLHAKMENVDSVDGETGGNGDVAVKGCCENCGVSCNELKEYAYGKLCSSCHHHWRYC